jgi:LmbE family N-acetylglucosaminyl deacetylase
MATLVSFHAHPDDESIACGGVMRKASEEGHRVVLVVATRGERGEVAEGFLEEGEELWQRRVAETQAAAAILGVHRVEFLGYTDSGMMGTPANTLPGSFWTAPVDEAAKKLAAILAEEQADVLTCYDDNGGYGHPDHIQVHRAGMRAAELAGTRRVFQNTMNRDHIRRGREWFTRQTAEARSMSPPIWTTSGAPCGHTPARSASNPSSSPCPMRRSPTGSAPSGSSARGRARASPRRICWPACDPARP